MTYKEQIQYILENKKFPIKNSISVLKSIGRLLFSIIAIGGFVLFIYLALTTNFLLEDKRRWFLLIFETILVCYGIVVLASLKSETNSDKSFEEFLINNSAKENLSVMTKIVESNFKVQSINVDDNNNVINILTKASIWTWGDEITVICDNNRVLINSKASRNQFFSYGQERRNMKKIRIAISAAVIGR